MLSHDVKREIAVQGRSRKSLIQSAYMVPLSGRIPCSLYDTLLYAEYRHCSDLAEQATYWSESNDYVCHQSFALSYCYKLALSKAARHT